MKVLVLYRPNSEHGRGIETFIRDFRYQHESNAGLLDVQDIDTRDGVATASLYDVVQYPAVLVLGDDGQLLKSWQGEDMPLMDEVAGYVYGG
jgi:uncharacterized protein YbbC (DUF1343 family)